MQASLPLTSSVVYNVTVELNPDSIKDNDTICAIFSATYSTPQAGSAPLRTSQIDSDRVCFTYSPAEASKSSKLTGGEIAGIVIGIIVFLILVVLILVFLMRKKRNDGKEAGRRVQSVRYDDDPQLEQIATDPAYESTQPRVRGQTHIYKTADEDAEYEAILERVKQRSSKSKI